MTEMIEPARRFYEIYGAGEYFTPWDDLPKNVRQRWRDAASGIAAAAHSPRVQDLLEANNRYLERARSAEAALAATSEHAVAHITTLGLKLLADGQRADVFPPNVTHEQMRPLFLAADAMIARQFALGDRVHKIRGSSWQGFVVGFYSTTLTPIGYAVESEREPGSVQIYPESALASAPTTSGSGDQP